MSYYNDQVPPPPSFGDYQEDNTATFVRDYGEYEETTGEDEEVTLCERCGEGVISVNCSTCRTTYCQECATELHSKGKWQQHQLGPIEGKGSLTQSSSAVPKSPVMESFKPVQQPQPPVQTAPVSQQPQRPAPVVPQQPQVPPSLSRLASPPPQRPQPAVPPPQQQQQPQPFVPQQQQPQPFVPQQQQPQMPQRPQPPSARPNPMNQIPSIPQPMIPPQQQQRPQPPPVRPTPTPTPTPASPVDDDIPPPPPDEEEEEWMEARAPDGRTYYVNRKTKKSSWVNPKMSIPLQKVQSEDNVPGKLMQSPGTLPFNRRVQSQRYDANEIAQEMENQRGTSVIDPSRRMAPSGKIAQLGGNLAGVIGMPPSATVRSPRGPAPPRQVPKKAANLIESKSVLTTLVINEPVKGITVEKKFSIFTTIGQVADWCAKQFFNQSSEKKDKGKEYYSLKLRDKWMPHEKCIFAYGINQGEYLILAKKVYTPEVVNISVPDLKISFKLEADETTSVWELTQQVIRKVSQQRVEWTLPFPPDQYGLFADNRPEELNLSELLESYKPYTNLQYKRRAIPPENYDFQLEVLCMPSGATLAFSSRWTVDECIKFFSWRHFLKFNSLTGPNQFGFQIPSNDGEEEGEWLQESQIISQVRFVDRLVHFKKRCYDYRIQLPDGKEHVISIDDQALVKDLFDVVEWNYPNFFDNGISPRDYCLIADDVVLKIDQPLTSLQLDKGLVLFRRRPQQLVIFVDKSQVTLEVDFTLAITHIMPSIWKQINLEPKMQNEFTLRRLSPDIPVDMIKSLNAQGINPNAALTLKFLQVDQNKQGVLGEKVNLWEEPLSNATASFEGDDVNNGIIKAGSINKLVDYLTNRADINFVKAFLMTYKSFCTPHLLFQKLQEKFLGPPQTSSQYANFKKNEKATQLRVCSVMKQWMENYWEDFDHELTEKFTDFTDSLPADLNALANQLRTAVLKRNCSQKTQGATASRSRGKTGTAAIEKMVDYPPSITKLPKKKLEPGAAVNIFDFDELEIARQITLREQEMYRKIRPSELLDQSWNKAATKHLSVNVLECIRRANDISLWVVKSILEPVRVKVRAQRFAKLIAVAANLEVLNNFSSLMAFLGGFNNSSIARLKFTKEALPKKSQETLARLEALMSVESSSKAYRERLRTSTPPIIPYLGTYLSDLTFIDEGNPDLVTANKLINFAKRVLIYRAISEIKQYQEEKYVLRPFNGIIKHLETIKGPADQKEFEKQMYDISLQLEPRGAEKVN